jgi:Dioxygenase
MLEASTNEGNAMNDFEKVRMTRRGSLLRLGGLVATVAGGGALVEAETAGAGPAAVASGAVKCVLTPELTEGPYYIAGEKVRRDITEGKSGVPLFLKTTVVSASNCKPIKGAAVDVWHCDAGGVYSGFGSASSGQGGGPGFGGGGGGGGQQTPTDKLTFLRGIQYTDKNGLAVFKTIYPGWYQGRAVHIHVKVHVGGSVVHTASCSSRMRSPRRSTRRSRTRAGARPTRPTRPIRSTGTAARRASSPSASRPLAATSARF